MEVSMKKLLVLCAVACFLCACSTKDDPAIDVDSVNQEQQEEVEHANYVSLNYTGIKVKTDYVQLDYEFQTIPYGKEAVLHVIQDGIPIEFALRPEGEYALTHRHTFPQENNKGSVYVRAKSLKEGQKLNIGMGFINNPDYMPEVSEYTRYDGTIQTVTFASKDLEADKTFSGFTEPKIKQDIQWEVFDKDTNKSIIPAYFENNIKGTLYDLTDNKGINEANVMHLKKGETFKTYLLYSSIDADPNTRVVFYVDHKPVKIEGKYDAAQLDFDQKGFGITELELNLSENIEKGKHIYYAVVFEEGRNKERNFYHFYKTDTRMIIIE